MAEVPVASVGKRAIAHAVDMFIGLFLVMDVIVPLLFGSQWVEWLLQATQQMQQTQQLPDAPKNPMMLVTAMVLPFVYASAFWYGLGATPLQYFMGMRVVSDKTGQRLPLYACITRALLLYGMSFLFLIVPFVGIASVVLLIMGVRKHPYLQGFHDTLCGSMVISIRPEDALKSDEQRDSSRHAQSLKHGEESGHSEQPNAEYDARDKMQNEVNDQDDVSEREF